MSIEFAVTTEELAAGRALVCLQGEVDIYTAPRFKEALLDLERRTAPYIGCASTRIFCRKGCVHERRVREGGRIHFASGADAEASGYRACKVCRPA